MTTKLTNQDIYERLYAAISERRLRFTFTEPSRGMAIAEMEGDEAAAQRA